MARRGSVLSQLDLPGITRAEPDFARLGEQLTELAPDLLVIEGGDGTVQAAVTALLRQGKPLPRCLLVPGGMTDLVARIGGAPRDRGVLRRLIERGGNVLTLPVLRIENGDEDLYGFFLSTGAVPRGIDYAREAIHSKGAEGAVAVLGAMAGAMMNGARREAITAPSPARILLDEEEVFPDHRFALVTSLPELMVGLDPFWGEGDGAVRATIARGHSRHLRRSLAQVWLGRTPIHADRNGYVSRNVSRLVIDTPAPVVLDGERIEVEGPLTITAPAALEVLIP